MESHKAEGELPSAERGPGGVRLEQSSLAGRVEAALPHPCPRARERSQSSLPSGGQQWLKKINCQVQSCTAPPPPREHRAESLTGYHGTRGTSALGGTPGCVSSAGCFTNKRQEALTWLHKPLARQPLSPSPIEVCVVTANTEKLRTESTRPASAGNQKHQAPQPRRTDQPARAPQTPLYPRGRMSLCCDCLHGRCHHPFARSQALSH